MTPSETSASRLRRILAEVQADRAAFQKRAGEVVVYADRALTAEQAAAAALAMERAYTALESILERVTRAEPALARRGGSPDALPSLSSL